MQKILNITGHNDLHELDNQLLYRLDALEATGDAKVIIDECIEIAKIIQNVHKDEYRRICERFDQEVYGDIMCTKRGSNSEVETIGVDGLKRIVFEEMGFKTDERLE